VSAAFFSDLWRSDGGAAPRWEQEGKLILHPAQKIAAGRLYDITFVLHNAEEGQEARTHCSIHLSKLLDEYEFPVRVNDFVKESLFSGPGNLAPLLVFDFLNDSSMIIQSSPSVSIANNSDAHAADDLVGEQCHYNLKFDRRSDRIGCAAAFFCPRLPFFGQLWGYCGIWILEQDKRQLDLVYRRSLDAENRLRV
jgi:hypothetical protein